MIELSGEAPRREPEVETRVDQEAELAVVEDLRGHPDERLARHERARRERLSVVLAHELQDLRA